MKEKEIWSAADKIVSHITYGKAIEKNISLLNYILKQSNLDKKKIKNILDWGPGGGWLSKEFKGENLFLFDVSEKNEDIQRRTCIDNYDKIHFFDVTGETYPKLKDNIDLLIIFSVIYHMPSLNYVKNCLQKIEEYSPKYIALRNMFSFGECWQSDEFNAQTFLRMNLISEELLLSSLPSYSILSETEKEVAASINNQQCYSKAILLRKN